MPCQACGQRVILEEPHLVDLKHLIDEESYERNATLRGTCNNCGGTASTVGPVVFADGAQSYAILSLSASKPLPGDVLKAIVVDLLSVLPPNRRGQLSLYATHEAFLLERTHPDIYHAVDLDEVLGRDVTPELIMIEDIANSVQQAGEPLLALEHIYRILKYVPDFVRDRSFVENLVLLQALATIKDPDNPRAAELSNAINGYIPTKHGLDHPQVTWRVAYAFGPDAPLLHGIPAGYIVPSGYVDRERLPPDERAIVWFLLLLFSSALRRLVAAASDEQLLMHFLAQEQFTQLWSAATSACQSYLVDFYQEVSGRSLVGDLHLEEPPDPDL